jgi:pyrimidine and pyridine-specific 5'-nucleotidase
MMGAAGADVFAIRFGRAAILTAPPKLVALVETPDVAVGVVYPRKRGVVTATRLRGLGLIAGCVLFLLFSLT